MTLVRPNYFVKFAYFVIPITESDRFYVNFILTSRVKPIKPREILANMALTELKFSYFENFYFSTN